MGAEVEAVDELDHALDALFAGYVRDLDWPDWGRPVEKYECYESLDELYFLDHLPMAEQNRRLLAAGIRLLGEAERAAPPPNPKCVRVLGVFDWIVLDDSGRYACNHGTDELITPYLWCGDFAAKGMEHFRFLSPGSSAATFVLPTADAAGLAVRQSEAYQDDGCPQWVYVGTPSAFGVATT
ncbi:MAG: hypothetical protein ACT4QF_03575 [Sporichthyaceae bacterium]